MGSKKKKKKEKKIKKEKKRKKDKKQKGGNNIDIYNNIYNKLSNSVNKITYSSLLNNWTNELPITKLNDIMNEYGHPYMVKNKPNGFCIWKNNINDNIHKMIVLKDEMIPNSLPYHRYEFLYSHITIYIPPEYYTKVSNINSSIGYDPLKKELYKRF